MREHAARSLHRGKRCEADLLSEGLLGERDAAVVGAFADALRASRIRDLRLRVQLWAVPANGGAVLAALTGHPTLRSLSISFNRVSLEDACQRAVCEALVRLLRADAPALHSLRIQCCGLYWNAMSRVFKALAKNTHLRALECEQDRHYITVEQGRDTLLPAVRACASLRRLGWDCDRGDGPELDRDVQRTLGERPDKYAMLADLPPLDCW